MVRGETFSIIIQPFSVKRLRRAFVMPSDRLGALAKSRWLELGEICNVWLTEYRMSASVLFVMFRRSKGEEVSRRDGDRCRNMLASPAGNVQILNSIAPVGASD